MKQTIKYFLFLLAYTPIYIIAALKSINNSVIDSSGKSLPYKVIIFNNIIPLFLISLSIFLIAYFKVFAHLALRPKGNPLFIIKKIKNQRKEYVTYLGTYILPFIALKMTTCFDIAAVVFMFLTIGFIFSKTNLIYTNPTLAFFGYDIFEIEDDNGNVIDCISKDNFKAEDKPRGLKLGSNTFIISKWKKDN